MDQINNKENEEISQSELNLTEQELNKIFFSPGETKNDPVFTKAKKVTKRQPVKKEEPVEQEPVKEKQDEDEEINEVVKRPHGRPKIWTEERIEELKRIRRKEFEERKKKKVNTDDISKLALGQPLSEYERTSLIAKKIKQREIVEEEITKQRNINQKILTQKENPNIWNKPKCIDHKYKMLYFDANQISVSCEKCSAMSSMTISEWRRYLSEQRR